MIDRRPTLSKTYPATLSRSWIPRFLSRTLTRTLTRSLALAIALPMLLLATLAVAQPRPVVPRPVNAVTPIASDKDLAATQEELIRLLKLSPTLTTVVARDPSLLSNQEYVRRNNPQLAQYLDNHPEIALNPDFYLFTHLNGDSGQPDQALERKVWPEFSQHRNDRNVAGQLINDLGPFLVFVCALGTLIWITRMFVENRRWGRIFKQQMEVHGKLIERFGSNQELLTYMDTDAGRRFLEASPIPVGFEQQQRVPSAVARVLTPLQIGLVLALLGVGFLAVRRSDPEIEIPMLLLGTLFLMPGLGFILSAGISWMLASRLGLMPERSGKQNGLSAPYHPTDQQ